MIKRIKLLLCLILSTLLLGLFSSYNTLTWAAPGQNCQPQAAIIARATALITGRDLGGASNHFSNTQGICIEGGQQTAFSVIPDFTDLKRVYYDSAKTIPGKTQKNPIINGDITGSQIVTSNSDSQLFYVKNGSLVISQNLVGSSPVMVFVEKNLEFTDDYTYAPGTIFIVKGNVYIRPNVVRVDAVIIAEDTIYTASASGSSCSSSSVVMPIASALKINGSLISVGASSIRFCRTLTPANDKPAELIVAEPKYLALFGNLFATDFTQRVEDKVIGSYLNIGP